MPHGITQCYLPPGRRDIPALTPAEAGIWFGDPVGMPGWVDLVSWDGNIPAHPGTNRARRALTSFMRRTPLTLRHATNQCPCPCIGRMCTPYFLGPTSATKRVLRSVYPFWHSLYSVPNTQTDTHISSGMRSNTPYLCNACYAAWMLAQLRTCLLTWTSAKQLHVHRRRYLAVFA